jgi:uncharacterized protein
VTLLWSSPSGSPTWPRPRRSRRGSPDESSIKPFLDVMGEDRLIYASDYSHWDAKFPGTVDTIADRTELTDAWEAKVLGTNAKRLFTRLA